jgi:hypothetical protein
MYLQIDSQRTLHRAAFVRFADWWPAALVGLLALLGSLPDANAQSLLGL